MPYNLEIPGQVDELQLKAIEVVAAAVPKDGHIVEVGSLFGRTSWAWAKSVHPSVTVHCIDPWAGNVGVRPFEEEHGIRYSLEQFLEYTSDCDNIVVHQGYSPRDFADWNLAIDLYYEDAVHVDPTFSANLAHWIERLTAQGIICGDDHRPRFPDIVYGVNRWSSTLNRPIRKVGNFWCLLPTDPSSTGVLRASKNLLGLEQAFHSGFDETWACSMSLSVVDGPATSSVTIDVSLTNSGSAAWPRVDQYGLARLRLSVKDEANDGGWRLLAVTPLSTGVVVPDIVYSERFEVAGSALPADSAHLRVELLDWAGNVQASETKALAVPSASSRPGAGRRSVHVMRCDGLTAKELDAASSGETDGSTRWKLSVPAAIKRAPGQRTVVTIDMARPLDQGQWDASGSTSCLLAAFIVEAPPVASVEGGSPSHSLQAGRPVELLDCLPLEIGGSHAAAEAQIDLRADFWPVGVQTVRIAMLADDPTGGVLPVATADVEVETIAEVVKTVEGSYRHPKLVEWLATGEPQRSWQLGTFQRIAQHQYLFRTVAGDRMVSSMLSQYELGVLASYARVGYTGAGAIVDGGSLLGGSTLALAGGLANNVVVPEQVKYGAIHAFDLWRLEGYSSFLENSPTVVNGNLLPVFLRNVEAYSPWVRPYPGDFLSWDWQGGAVEFLHLDHLKSEELNDHCVRTLFPHLVPEIGIVIQQDYIHFNEYWVHYTMETFAEYFEPMGFYYGASGVFRLRKPIPRSMFAAVPSRLSYSEKLLLLERARARAPIQIREVMKVAAAKCALDHGDASTAGALLADVEFGEPPKDRWLPIQGVLRSNHDIVEGMLKRFMDEGR